MKFKIALGLVLGFAIGIGCAMLNIPLPAPQAIIGALLVVAMTSGFLLCDYMLAKHELHTKTYNHH